MQRAVEAALPAGTVTRRLQCRRRQPSPDVGALSKRIRPLVLGFPYYRLTARCSTLADTPDTSATLYRLG